MKNNEPENLIGCCGLFCGLCNKYQSSAPSRCRGCQVGEQHSWCSIWNCCVKKRGFATCTECGEIFNCEIFVRRKVGEWIPAVENLRQMIETGIENWLNEQIERQRLVEDLIRNYNEGRSTSFYCKACARMPVVLIHRAIEESKEKLAREQVDASDMKSKAKFMKAIITERALERKINLS